MALCPLAGLVPGLVPGSRRPDSFMSPKSSISTPVEDLPGTMSHVPSLAGLNSKVLSLKHANAKQSNEHPMTIAQLSNRQNPQDAVSNGMQTRGRQQNPKIAGRAAVAGLDNKRAGARVEREGEETLSEIEAMLQEEGAVAAAGAAAVASAHALSALDLFVGTTGQVGPAMPQYIAIHICVCI